MAVKARISLFFSLVMAVSLMAGLNSRDRHWAVYYGWPSLVRGTNSTGSYVNANQNTVLASQLFGEYQVIVFNGMVEQTNEPNFDAGEAARTKSIITKLHDSYPTKVFGYIPIGGANTWDPPYESTNFMKGMIDDWIDEYNVDGFFFDEAGFDYHNNDQQMRDRQRAVANHVHSRLTNLSGTTLTFIMNAWEPDDIYTKLSGTPINMQRGDGFCIENFWGEGADSADYFYSAAVENARFDKLFKIYTNYSKQNKKQEYYCLTVGRAGNNFIFRTNLDKLAQYSVLAYDYDFYNYQDYAFSANNNVLNYHRHSIVDIGNYWANSNILHLVSGSSNIRTSDRGHVVYKNTYTSGSRSTAWATYNLDGYFIGSTRPAIIMLTPSGSQGADKQFTVNLNAVDPQYNAGIILQYRTNRTGSSWRTIVSGLPESTKSYVWVTSNLAMTNYLVRGIITNTGISNNRTTNVANGSVKVLHDVSIVLDQHLADWPSTAMTNNDADEGHLARREIRGNGVIDIGEYLYFYFKIEGSIGYDEWRDALVFIDSDNNELTGFTGGGWPWTGAGFDYRVRVGLSTDVWEMAVGKYTNLTDPNQWDGFVEDSAHGGLAASETSGLYATGVTPFTNIEFKVKLSDIGASQGNIRLAFYYAFQTNTDFNNDGGGVAITYSMQGGGDTTAPESVFAENITLTNIRILFNEAISPASATNKLNYVIDNGVGTPKSVVMSGTKTVILTLNSPLLGGNNYVINLLKIADLAQNTNQSHYMGFAADSVFINIDGDTSDWPAYMDRFPDKIFDATTNGNPPYQANRNYSMMDITTNATVALNSKLYFAYKIKTNIGLTNTTPINGLDNIHWKSFDVYIDADKNDATGEYSLGPWWVWPPIGADFLVHLGVWNGTVSESWLRQYDSGTGTFKAVFSNFPERMPSKISNNTLEFALYKNDLNLVQDSIYLTFRSEGWDGTLAKAVDDYNKDPTSNALTSLAKLPVGSPLITSIATPYSSFLLVTFDRKLDNSMTNKSFYNLSGGIGNPSKVGYMYDGLTTIATLYVSPNLTENTSYTLSVSTGVKDMYNNSYSAGDRIFAAVFMHHSDVVLNEILIDPTGLNETQYEWVELYNKGAYSIYMTNWELNINDGGTSLTLPTVTINPGDLVVFSVDTNHFQDRWAATNGGGHNGWGTELIESYALYKYAATAMPNSAQTIFLSDKSGYTDAIRINAAPTTAVSFEKINYVVPDSTSRLSPTIITNGVKNNWGLCTNNKTTDIYPLNDANDAGTPGHMNSIYDVGSFPVGAPILTVNTSFSNITLGGVTDTLKPGATLQYWISGANTGTADATNASFIEMIQTNLSFKTCFMVVGSGWNISYATNQTSIYPSAGQFSGTVPSDKNRIRWVRADKPFFLQAESMKLVFKVIVK